MGYFLFFLYFYKTEHWKNLDWPERVFFGFLLGLFTVVVLFTAVFPLTFLLVAFRLENQISNLIYVVPVVFIILLTLLRLKFKTPLCSKTVFGFFNNYLNNNRSYWPYLMIIFSLTAFLLLGLSNSQLSSDSIILWQSFAIVLNFFVLASSVAILWFVVALASLSSNVHPFEIGEKVMKCYFASFFKRKVCCLERIREEEKSQTSSRFKFKRLHFNLDFFQKMLLVALLVMVVLASDGAFQVFGPKLQSIETHYPSTQINVSRFWNGSLMYTTQVEKTYRINLPLVPIRYLNLSVPNPSNLSSNDIDKLLSPYRNNLGLSSESEKGLSCYLIRDPKGAIKSISIMALNGSLQKDSAVVKLDYADILSLDLIEITEPVETHIENNSIRVTMSLHIKNTEPWELYSYNFPLFPVQNYGNMTSFTWIENGQEKPSYLNIVQNEWLWAFIQASPNTSKDITVSAVFMEKE